jgi:hypothetical protein
MRFFLTVLLQYVFPLIYFESRQFNSNARFITFRIFIITHQYILTLSSGIRHGIFQRGGKTRKKPMDFWAGEPEGTRVVSTDNQPKYSLS